MSRFSTYFAALILAFGLSAGAATAVTVTYDSVDYDVTTISGTFDDNSALLMSQIWWGDRSVANAFATLVDTALGGPNGPLFAYSEGGGRFNAIHNLASQLLNPGYNAPTSFNNNQPFAVASPISAVPLPAGLPLLIAGLGCIAGLRMRKKRGAQV